MSLYRIFCVSLQRSGFSLLQINEGGAAASLTLRPCPATVQVSIYDVKTLQYAETINFFLYTLEYVVSLQMKYKLYWHEQTLSKIT